MRRKRPSGGRFPPPDASPKSPYDAKLVTVVIIARYRQQLDQIGLTSLEQVRRCRPADVVETHRGYREISRIELKGPDGAPRTLYLKRVWKAHLKDGLRSLLRRGRVWSVCRQEWENSVALQRAGIATAELVAFGEECGPLRERFSFIITRAADGDLTLQQFLRDCSDPKLRRGTLQALARHVRAMHDQGFFAPDLFARHIFIDSRDRNGSGPGFCLIDMARLRHGRPGSRRLRVLSLAALCVSVPLAHGSIRERLRFLRSYGGPDARDLIDPVRRRIAHLLSRPKFAAFSTIR